MADSESSAPPRHTVFKARRALHQHPPPAFSVTRPHVLSGSDLNAKFANFEEMLEKVSVLDDHEDDMNLGERDVVENYGMVGVHMPALPTAESLSPFSLASRTTLPSELVWVC